MLFKEKTGIVSFYQGRPTWMGITEEFEVPKKKLTASMVVHFVNSFLRDIKK